MPAIFHTTFHDADYRAEANNQTCPSGRRAYEFSIFDNIKGVLSTLFGETCADLVCPDGYDCVQVNVRFAKCCEQIIEEKNEEETKGEYDVGVIIEPPMI